MRAWLAALALLSSGCVGTVLATGPGRVDTYVDEQSSVVAAPKTVSAQVERVAASAAGATVTLKYAGRCDEVASTTEVGRFEPAPVTAGLLAGAVLVDLALIGSQVAALQLHDDPAEVRPWVAASGASVVIGTTVGAVLWSGKARRARPEPVVTSSATEVDCPYSQAMQPVAARVLPAPGGSGLAVEAPASYTLTVPAPLAGRALLLGPAPMRPELYLETDGSTGETSRLIAAIAAERFEESRVAWMCGALGASAADPLPPGALAAHRVEAARVCPAEYATAKSATCAQAWTGADASAAGPLCR